MSENVFTITPIKRKKGRRWRLEYRLNGERHRPSFKTKELAELEEERIRAQIKDSGSAWLSLTANERGELMAVYREIQAQGKSLRAVWEEYKLRSDAKQPVDKKLAEAFEQFMTERKSLHLSKRRIAALKSNVGRFVKQMPSRLAAHVTRQDIMDFLKPFENETFNTYRRCLNTFFEWCVRGPKCCRENPVASVEAIHERRMPNRDVPPQILKYKQCLALLKATLELDPALIRFTSTCLLAGLRPEREAPSLRPGDVGEQIHVRGRTAKDRQERYIPVAPALREWLAYPLHQTVVVDKEESPPMQGPAGSDWPIKNLRRRFDAVRERAGLIKIEYKTRPKKKGKGVVRIGKKITEAQWQQDCMRHTFASAHYAVYGAEKTIAVLGHGDYESLFGHYRRLMTREEGERILNLTPDVVRDTNPK